VIRSLPSITVLAQSGVEFAPERSLLVIAIACGLLGLAIAAGLATRAATPTTSPASSPGDLTESPALVDHLLGDGMVSTMALPATVIDLADRGHVTLDQPITASTPIRTDGDRRSDDRDLLGYELNVLERLGATDQLTMADLSWTDSEGPNRLHRSFDATVGREARRRNLTAARFPLWGGLAVLATVVAGGVAFGRALPDDGVDVQWNLPSLVTLFVLLTDALVASAVLIPDVRQRTPTGNETVARWLDARARAEAGDYGEPLRPAHRAVLDLAPHPLDGSDVVATDPRRLWSRTLHGYCRPLRVGYPRWWPPGAGRPPLLIVALGSVGLAAVGAVALAIWRRGYGIDWIDFSDIGPTRSVAIVTWTILCVGGVLAATMIAVALLDLFSYQTRNGTLSTTRTGIGSPVAAGRWSAALSRLLPGLSHRRFLVVDDGHSDATRALVVSARVQSSSPPGQPVDLVASPILGHVRSVRVFGSDS